jgi:nicotinamide mononucleotide adenylyltransferase
MGSLKGLTLQLTPTQARSPPGPLSSWREAVTPSTAEFIEEIGGVERIRWAHSRD